MGMIHLAIEHSDLAMLNELRAREMPSIYLSGYSDFRTITGYDRFSPDLIRWIAEAKDDRIILYFAEEFQAETATKDWHTYLFPFMSVYISRQ